MMNGNSELVRLLNVLNDMVALRLEQRGSKFFHKDLSQQRIEYLSVRKIHDEPVRILPGFDSLQLAGPFAVLVKQYGLDELDMFILLALLAPYVDEKFAVLYQAFVDRVENQDITVEVLRNLLGANLSQRQEIVRRCYPYGRLHRMNLIRFEGMGLHPLRKRIELNPELLAALLDLDYYVEYSDEFPAKRLTTLHRWEDLVLPDKTLEQLKLIIQRISIRHRVAREWGFAGKHDFALGFHILFYGPPGTGKSLAAALIGKQTGVPIYRIDLSNVVSKYIGETQKNIGRIFDEAERHQWILLFDEADSLFSKRTEVGDARDRYANMEVNYLLQRLESYNGISLLATNLATQFDPAVRRRIHQVVEFKEPDFEARIRLWQNIFPDKTPLAQDVVFEQLAEDFVLTGAEIKNAAFFSAHRAAYRNEPVQVLDILNGVRQEYEKGERSMPEGVF